MAADERTTRELKRAAVLAHEYGVDFRIADLIARAELEREGKLVTMLKQLLPVLTANGCPAWRARAEEVLAVYESEFAPPKRTLAQVAADVVALRDRLLPDGGRNLLDELAEALKHEGGA